MITLLEENKHNMKNYPGDYKGHSYKVLTSESIYDLIYTDEDDKNMDKMISVATEEAYQVPSKYLPDFEYDKGYPAIWDFKSDSKEIYEYISNFDSLEDYEQLIQYDGYDLWDVFEDITWDPDKGLNFTSIEDVQDICSNKMGSDLVLWDTGFIGYIGYDNYGPSKGVELLPIDYDKWVEDYKAEFEKIKDSAVDCIVYPMHY